MNSPKNALVIFSKCPEPGVTKTRLMEENGGVLTGQEAADLYQSMMLDTATVACHALKCCRKDANLAGEFDFFVFTTPASVIPTVKAMFDGAISDEPLHYMVDRGENFDEHFNDCYNQLFEKGYHKVVCVGGDMPAMTPDLIVRVFTELTRLESISGNGAMALAPCQAGGVSLVGVTRTANMDFRGVFYNPDGMAALDALIYIAKRKNIPTALFEALSDVDFVEDLGHMVTVVNAMAYTARFQPDVVVPQRTLDFIKKVGLYNSTPPNTSHDPRIKIDG